MKTPFYFMLYKTFHSQRNHIRMDMKEHHLSPGQPKVLRYLDEHPDCMLKDIAANCDVEPATVSKILSDLERSGMLIRAVGMEDKRALRLTITKKGKTALAWWVPHCEAVDDRSLQGFSENERKQFEDFLRRMYYNLNGRPLE